MKVLPYFHGHFGPLIKSLISSSIGDDIVPLVAVHATRALNNHPINSTIFFTCNLRFSNKYKAIGLALLRKENQRKNWQYSEQSQKKDWATFYGIAPEFASNVWNKLVARGRIPNAAKPKHLLFAYIFLKVYSGDKPMSKIVGCHFNTFSKWAWIFIRLVHGLHQEVIRFENRLINWDWTKTNASCTVD